MAALHHLYDMPEFSPDPRLVVHKSSSRLVTIAACRQASESRIIAERLPVFPFETTFCRAFDKKNPGSNTDAVPCSR